VRWTERRNLAEFLRLIASGTVQVAPLVGRVFQVDDAASAYVELRTGDPRPLAVVLAYPEPDVPGEDGETVPARVVRLSRRPALSGTGQAVNVAVVGAGGFARGMHLPNLMSMPDLFRVRAVIDAVGHAAKSAADQFGAAYAGTDFADVLADDEVDAVIVTTRHHLHAPFVLRALEAGKHVFVEKPLVLSRPELDLIVAFYRDRGGDAAAVGPLLQTGFNRRFSPAFDRVREAFRDRSNPMIVSYRMNAGYVALDDWVHSETGGGRNLGEACHIYDLFTCLTDAEIESVTAHSLVPATGHYSARDNFVAVVRFADGSVCSLTYTAMGSRDYPKELMEVYADGKVANLTDYKSVVFHGVRAAPFRTRRLQKGHREEMAAFGRAIRDGTPWPIPLWHQIQAMEIALRVDEML